MLAILLLRHEYPWVDSWRHAPYLPEGSTLASESPLERNAPGLLPLIGRSVEKQVLLALLEPTFNRTGALIAIEGEPGIGRSRLINEVQQDLEWHGAQPKLRSGPRWFPDPGIGAIPLITAFGCPLIAFSIHKGFNFFMNGGQGDLNGQAHPFIPILYRSQVYLAQADSRL